MLDQTFPPHGKHLVAGEWVASDRTFRSEPATGDAHDFSVGTPERVDRACEAAEDAFPTYANTSREERAAFLDAIADEIEARGDAITAIGTSETGLPDARLQGERGRTTGQLRLFASHIREGACLDRRHDGALPDRQPLQMDDGDTDADALRDAAKAALEQMGPQTMLTDGIAATCKSGAAAMAEHRGVTSVVVTDPVERSGTPFLFEADAETWFGSDELSEEVFGPVGLILRCKDAAEVEKVARTMQGQLTVTLQMDDGDTDAARALLPLAERKAGRVLPHRRGSGRRDGARRPLPGVDECRHPVDPARPAPGLLPEPPRGADARRPEVRSRHESRYP
ncbi:Aldehyde dehydrogenase family protein [Palleronia marisminoris]|uniref:Alpha-ketoglutaric semialdehyde dehydrogenase n=1 Tax=Palleronia marisminoris TaxID=315423 RepID=A0A1Y5TXC7_9RHOB|nr:Aldehyde dehydrogenase family protein [Palleronia marisminoris]SFH46975.1 Aldehyde dehydrogenase family protein [Palleronia marisminoris]SFH53032.1 Aldehyde dehydrogenase family protein [Palleronia marisminoris]SLN72385.1 Alpha-ketoglutaric semialdehyde dehydrogenase [Palleronia marisminoris]